MANSFRRVLCSAIIFVFCAAALFTSPAAAASNAAATNAQEFSTLPSKNIMLMDAATKTVLFDKKGHDRAFPASTTKIMTCILVLESGKNLDEIVTVGQVTDLGSLMALDDRGLEVDEKISIRDLLYGLMLFSGNDAAEALAVAIGGSKDTFVQQMNDKAKELGMMDTHYCNPNGLQNPEHYTTAYDMAILTCYAMQNETFRELVSTQTHKVPATNRRPEGYDLYNSNRLIYHDTEKENLQDLRYEYAIGVKTGSTNEAGNCLVAAAKKDDTELILVIFGDELSNNDGRFVNAKNIFEWAFVNREAVSVSDLNLTSSVDVLVEGVSKSDEYDGRLKLVADIDGQQIVGVKDALAEIKQNSSLITYETTYGALTAPIKEGDILGSIEYRFRENVILKADLVASRGVEAYTDSQETANNTPVVVTPPIDTGASDVIWYIAAGVGGVAVIATAMLLIMKFSKKKRRRSRYIFRYR